ncbi:hypothetical protein AVEN_87277-1 [Araneus ventricosus]|uniref:Uncharacterized protein n=1 Tax=Araneus ventricosus TaxID=182803 RepID=A0A4Y2EE56_ARAVE|nr:hypothetical protein AVEN_87277-1 [Araneus ventricosus]
MDVNNEFSFIGGMTSDFLNYNQISLTAFSGVNLDTSPGVILKLATLFIMYFVAISSLVLLSPLRKKEFFFETDDSCRCGQLVIPFTHMLETSKGRRDGTFLQSTSL